MLDSLKKHNEFNFNNFIGIHNILLKVRSAKADRGFQSIIPTTGCTRGYSKLDPPRRILFNKS